MGVFKEHARAFETVARGQKRIYSDAADLGYPYDANKPPEAIKELIEHVKDLRGTSLVKNRNQWTNGVTTKIEIAWEIDEGHECGTRYTISCNTGIRAELHPRCDAFISVDIEPYRTPVEGN